MHLTTHRASTLALSLSAALLFAACGSGSSGGAAGQAGSGGSSGTGGADGGPAACTAEEFRCTGDVLERCADDGSAFATVATCASGLCDAAGKQCDNCHDGGATCVSSSRVRACSADGQTQSESDCPGGTPFCSVASGNAACVQCLAATDCPASGNECALAACSADGTCGTKPVQMGTACGAVGAGGKCDGAGACRYCQPGDAKCDGLTPETCDATGQWLKGNACGGGESLCLGGACVQCASALDCPAGANDCVTPACSANACGYAPKAMGTACGSGLGKCDGAGQCNLCTPGTATCNGNVPLACGSNGQYAQQPACSGATPNCDPTTGACVECNTTSQCAQPANPCLSAVCSNHACGYAPKTTGTACPGGTCSAIGTCQACSPGSAVCSGNGVLTCNASGQYDPVASCSGGTPYCNAANATCVQCTSAGQCSQPANSCLQATCTGNACGIANKADGSACTTGSDAGTCSAGNCRVCMTGATRCKAGVTNTVQTCDTNGQWLDGTVCGGGTPLCNGAACTSGVRLAFFDVSRTWTAAEADCIARGGHLAVASDANDVSRIRTLVGGGTKRVWLGYTDNGSEGIWKSVWTNAVPSYLPSWGPGDPSGGTAENCYASTDLGGNDYPCNTAYADIGYACGDVADTTGATGVVN